MEMYCLSVIIQMLNPNNTLSFNRLLAHGIGLIEAIVYAILISKQSYYNANGMLYEGGWFYSTIDDLQESTTLGEKAQRTAIAHLVGYGLIECEKKGMPAKRYFRIVNNPEKINEILENGQRICDSFKNKSKGSQDSGSLPETPNKKVEKVLKTDPEMPANNVELSYRPKAATSDRPAQDKTKDNKNQRNFFDDSINQSARKKFFEEDSAAEISGSGYVPGEFAETLYDLGIDWYTLTATEPESEDCFAERDERSRRVSKCTVPYDMKNNRKKLINALKYVSCYSYYCGYDDCKNRDESVFCSAVIECLADIMTEDSVELSKQIVMYYQVFDKINEIIQGGSLYQWIEDFREHWEKVISKTDITHKRKYMRSCVWNFLNDYEITKFVTDSYSGIKPP